VIYWREKPYERLASYTSCDLKNVQRGIGLDDIELVESIGTQVGRGSYFIRRKDVQAYERQLKKKIDQARRLEGKLLVVKDDTVITTYHARQGKERRLLRSTDDRSLSNMP
jgi:hypothetical protein